MSTYFVFTLQKATDKQHGKNIVLLIQIKDHTKTPWYGSNHRQPVNRSTRYIRVAAFIHLKGERS
jgi:hypothetical protein